MAGGPVATGRLRTEGGRAADETSRARRRIPSAGAVPKSSRKDDALESDFRETLLFRISAKSRFKERNSFPRVRRGSASSDPKKGAVVTGLVAYTSQRALMKSCRG